VPLDDITIAVIVRRLDQEDFELAVGHVPVPKYGAQSLCRTNRPCP
jgi:hypothetical protein